MTRWAFCLGYLLVGLCVPAESVQAQQASAAVFVQAVAHPPAIWETIYHEVEACLRKKGKYKAVRWYVTAGPWGEGKAKTWGLWRVSSGKHSIIVARADTAVVRHEAVHDILWRNGFRPVRLPADSSTNPEHPMPPYGVCAKRWFP